MLRWGVDELLTPGAPVHGQTGEGWKAGVPVGSLLTGLLPAPAPVPLPTWLEGCDLGSNMADVAPDPGRKAFPGTCFVIIVTQEPGFL